MGHHIISHGWGPKDQNNCRCHLNLSGVAVDALAEDPLDEVDVVAGAVVDEGDPVDARAHPLAHPAAARARAPLAPVERLALGVSRAVHLQRMKETALIFTVRRPNWHHGLQVILESHGTGEC